MHPTEGVFNNLGIVYQNGIIIVNTKNDKIYKSLSIKIDSFLVGINRY
jgi:hypothetical protein